ncbi:hypothetical protein AB3N59_15545 [Leptospira sp. WS92.C1]
MSKDTGQDTEKIFQYKLDVSADPIQSDFAEPIVIYKDAQILSFFYYPNDLTVRSIVPQIPIRIDHSNLYPGGSFVYYGRIFKTMGLYALYPVAIAIDIVTAPILFPLFAIMMAGSRRPRSDRE